jgi:ankyrin repeat protein
MEAAWRRAAREGEFAAAKALLESGAEIDARDRYGQTALMIAAHHGHQALVELLIESGANLDVTGKYGLSALMLSVISGHGAIAEKLVRAGANRTLKGSGAPGFAGKTAYDLAVAREMRALYDELRL